MTMQSCRGNIVFSSLLALFFVISLSITPAYAQKTLETGESKKSGSASRTPDAVTDSNLSRTVQEYFQNLFEKNYEEAVKLMPQTARGDAAIAKIERWRERFMSPSDLKIINVNDNGDGTLTATATFNYMNANGVKDIMREKIVLSLSGGKYTVKSQPSLEAAARGAQAANQAAQATASGASNPGAGFPVTMSPNGGGAGMPDMAGLLSALSGGAGGAGATNIDPGELLGLMTEMVNDPDVLALSSNPKIMEIAKDPTIMSTLLSGNMTAIEANPKIKELLSDPAIRKIIEKVSSKRSNPSSGGDSGDGQPAAPPSSVNGVDVDKIFD